MTEEHEDREQSQAAGVRSEHMRSLRAIKAGATANHCSHGVPRDHCVDHRDEENSDV